MKKMVLQLTIEDDKRKNENRKDRKKSVTKSFFHELTRHFMLIYSRRVDSVAVDMKDKKMTVIGEADPVFVTARLRKYGFDFAELLSVGPAKEEKKEEKEEYNVVTSYYVHSHRPSSYYDYSYVSDENPNACSIC